MNILDIAVIVILAIFGLCAYRKGFIKACFGFLPMLLSLGGTYFLQPIVSKILRTTPIYTMIKNWVSNSLGLENLISEQSLQLQSNFIEQLQLPEFIKSALMENNNPVIYKVLDVTELEGYIAAFLANICVNILSTIFVIVAVYIAAKLVLATMELFSKIPVIGFLNQTLGLTVGLFQAVVIIWFFAIIATFFNCNPDNIQLFELIEQSVLAKWFYHNNLLLFFILKVFT